jgi:ubiquinone/menaquinone biosynthesis C-methylase UbiE
MAEKHYDASYLVDTVEILGQLKYNSYRYFETLPENSIVVDLGCGTGQDVLNMAKVFETKGFKFIGIDHDPIMIKNNESAADEHDNVNFLIADVSKLPFSDKETQGIRMERLVQHIPEPFELFKEVYRVLNEDGIVVVMESDWNSLTFYNGDPSIMDKITSFLVSQKVKNGRAAQSLTAYLKSSNFQQIKVEVYPFVLKSYEEACKYLWIDKILSEMLALKLIDQREYDDFVESQVESDRSNYFSSTMNIVIASAIK